MRRTITRFIKFAIPLGVIALGALLVSGFRARTETGVTAERANQRIHHKLDLPTTASDVDYYSIVSPYSIAEFSIARNDFTGWAESRSWTLTEVSPANFTMFRHAVTDPAEPTIIESGLVFDAMDGDFGFSGHYNYATGRASVSFSTR